MGRTSNRNSNCSSKQIVCLPSAQVCTGISVSRYLGKELCKLYVCQVCRVFQICMYVYGYVCKSKRRWERHITMLVVCRVQAGRLMRRSEMVNGSE